MQNLFNLKIFLQTMEHIKHIIFDLGRVILNIDWDRTSAALKQMGVEQPRIFFEQLRDKDGFKKLQTGHISQEDFLNEVRRYLPHNATDNTLIKAWNAMLVDFPPERLHIIYKLSKHYNTFLLSNTNIIHWNSYYPQYKKALRQEGLPDLFVKEYYSHEIGLAKPDPAIYKLVLHENNLRSEETLFLDDKEENLEAARALGIHTILVTPENDLKRIFEKIAV